MELDNFKYNLSRLKKCDQYWDEMTPVNGGKHCCKCDKKIVDFSNMTFADIAIYMSESKEPVCGFYRQEQLIQRKQIAPRLPLTITLTTLITTGTVSKAEMRQHETEQCSITHKTDEDITQNSDSQVRNDTVYVQGRVQYHDTTKKVNLPIPYAAIVIKGTKTGVSATNNGDFLLRYLPTEQTDKLRLVVSSIGFNSKEIELTINEQKQVDLGNIILEEASVIEFYVTTKKRSKLNKFWRKLTKPFRSQ